MAKHLQRITALAALVGGAFLSANVAAADPLSADQCAQSSGTVAVEAVAISPGRTITLHQTGDGTFQGDATVRVFCESNSGTDLGPIANSSVKISINPVGTGVSADMFSIAGLNGVATTNASATTPGNPVILGPFPGVATYRITGSSVLLAPGIALADVGVHLEVVADAWGSPLNDGGITLDPTTQGNLLASTPELDSLALFGTGMLGMLGYGVTRLRARRATATPDRTDGQGDESASS
jgi:hypothetical protein